jgi:hypothetical protein
MKGLPNAREGPSDGVEVHCSKLQGFFDPQGRWFILIAR